MGETVGIVGLGLIGGSLAKALHAYTDRTVLGYDADGAVLTRALEEEVLSGVLTPERLAECDLVIVALYPAAAVEYVTCHRDQFRKGGLVMDCCGVKGVVCTPLEPVAREGGFTFVGGHPMAGIERSGYAHAFPELFRGASLILTPYEGTEERHIQAIWELAKALGFGRLTRSTPEEHDRIIAYTSQLPHALACAYVMSPRCRLHKGFSAGSYKDLTRVAWLNPGMWAELFLANKENILKELDVYIHSLCQYRDAIVREDEAQLVQLLEDGRRRKKEVDG